MITAHSSTKRKLRSGFVLRAWRALQACSRHRLRNAERQDDGNAIVEIALTLPLVVLMVTVIWQMGLLFNQMISLTQAAAVAAQVLQSDRLSASNDPCADTFNALTAAAPTLTPSNIVITLTLNNNSSITKTNCPGSQTQLVQGGPVTVQATYPFTFSLLGYTTTAFSGTMSSGAITEIEY